MPSSNRVSLGVLTVVVTTLGNASELTTPKRACFEYEDVSPFGFPLNKRLINDTNSWTALGPVKSVTISSIPTAIYTGKLPIADGQKINFTMTNVTSPTQSCVHYWTNLEAHSVLLEDTPKPGFNTPSVERLLAWFPSIFLNIAPSMNKSHEILSRIYSFLPKSRNKDLKSRFADIEESTFDFKSTSGKTQNAKKLYQRVKIPTLDEYDSDLEDPFGDDDEIFADLSDEEKVQIRSGFIRPEFASGLSDRVTSKSIGMKYQDMVNIEPNQYEKFMKGMKKTNSSVDYLTQLFKDIKLPQAMGRKTWETPIFTNVDASRVDASGDGIQFGIFSTPKSTKDLYTPAYKISVDHFKKVKPEPKKSYLIENFVPYSQKRLRKMLGYTKVVSRLAAFMSTRPLFMVLGSEDGLQSTNHMGDRWFLQLRGKSRWRVEKLQLSALFPHFKGESKRMAAHAQMLQKKHAALRADKRKECNEENYPILLKESEIITSPERFMWEACRPKESENETPILIGGVEPSRHYPELFKQVIARNYGLEEPGKQGKKELLDKKDIVTAQLQPIQMTEPRQNFTVLDVACRVGDAGLVKKIVDDFKMDPFHTQSASMTNCGHHAATLNQVAVTEFLLKKTGVKSMYSSTQTEVEHTPIHMASRYFPNGLGDQSVLEVGLQYILDHFEKEKQDRTIDERFHYNVADLPDKTDLTPLKLAIINKSPEAVKILLKTGKANPQQIKHKRQNEKKDHKNEGLMDLCEPIFFAAARGEIEVMEVFIKHDDMSAYWTCEGDTLLHLAINLQLEDVVNYLIAFYPKLLEMKGSMKDIPVERAVGMTIKNQKNPLKWFIERKEIPENLLQRAVSMSAHSAVDMLNVYFANNQKGNGTKLDSSLLALASTPDMFEKLQGKAQMPKAYTLLDTQIQRGNLEMLQYFLEERGTELLLPLYNYSYVFDNFPSKPPADEIRNLYKRQPFYSTNTWGYTLSHLVAQRCTTDKISRKKFKKMYDYICKTLKQPCNSPGRGPRSEGRTPMMLASGMVNDNGLRCVEYLIKLTSSNETKRNMTVQHKDEKNRTALLYALANNNRKVAKKLLKAGGCVEDGWRLGENRMKNATAEVVENWVTDHDLMTRKEFETLVPAWQERACNEDFERLPDEAVFVDIDAYDLLSPEALKHVKKLEKQEKKRARQKEKERKAAEAAKKKKEKQRQKAYLKEDDEDMEEDEEDYDNGQRSGDDSKSGDIAVSNELRVDPDDDDLRYEEPKEEKHKRTSEKNSATPKDKKKVDEPNEDKRFEKEEKKESKKGKKESKEDKKTEKKDSKIDKKSDKRQKIDDKKESKKSDKTDHSDKKIEKKQTDSKNSKKMDNKGKKDKTEQKKEEL